jgi:uncharacterized protein (DUF362 family)
VIYSTFVTANYTVRAVHCDYRSDDEGIYQALARATAPLTRAWERLGRARKIAIKFNQDWEMTRTPHHEGQRQQLVSDGVGRAVLRLLQERTKAEIFAVDLGVEGARPGEPRERSTNMAGVLKEYNVPYVDGHMHGVVWKDVPGGGLIFDRYPVSLPVAEADEVISVQKLKNHAYMGITLSLKNLFGLVPLVGTVNGPNNPPGRPRGYYHHLVRMPYMLADYGKLLDPALNILDGLVTQAGEEWGRGENPRICNTLIAGDQTITTDACGAHLMGHDPAADWLTPPYHRDRNALLVAAQGGFGTVDLKQIDFQSEMTAPVGEFFTKQFDERQMVITWRRTMAEQGLFYREHRAELVERYAGQYILLQMGEVRWSDPSGRISVSRRELAGTHPEQAMWLKYVDPDEDEREHFEIYDQTLEQIKTLE